MGIDLADWNWKVVREFVLDFDLAYDEPASFVRFFKQDGTTDLGVGWVLKNWLAPR